MSLESQTQVIEGLTVTCTQLPAMKAYSVFARLSKAVGPAIAALSGVDLNGTIEEIDVTELAPALAKLLEGIAEDESLALALLASVSVRRDEADILLSDEARINLAFAGKFKAMLLTLKFSLQVNFSDFLGDGLAALAKAKAKAPKAKESE